MSTAPGARVLKRGETLFKEGDKILNLFLIQSGQISLQLVRGKPIELFNMGANQVLCEYYLSGQSAHPYTAVATSEVKLLELPLEAVKQQLEQAPQVIKLLTKSSLDRIKVMQSELKSFRMERDSNPCPHDQLAKVFATIHHVARHKGEVQKDGSLLVSWPKMKQYAQRLFLESPKRLESAVKILVRLGYAKYDFQAGGDETGSNEELNSIVFTNTEIAEWVAEHWQYYYFKGGKSELLKTDEKVMQVVAAMVAYSADLEPDRNGSVSLEFSTLVERFKSESTLSLNADFFLVIENKGLMVKRLSAENGVLIQFERKEFVRWSHIWTVLKEVERWNERGVVDDEPAFDPRRFQKAISGPQCPSCGNGYQGTPKFCAECGHKLSHAA
jgi:CRP-like cAMP-binding protein